MLNCLLTLTRAANIPLHTIYIYIFMYIQAETCNPVGIILSSFAVLDHQLARPAQPRPASGQTIISRTLAALTLKMLQLRNVYVNAASTQSKRTQSQDTNTGDRGRLQQEAHICQCQRTTGGWVGASMKPRNLQVSSLIMLAAQHM